MADALLSIHELSPMDRNAMGARGKEFLIREHDFRVLSLRLGEFYHGLLAIEDTSIAEVGPVNP